jgi:release factor glutamine methyltransferase
MVLNAMTTLRAAITALTTSFREAGLATPGLDARLLALHACGIPHEAFFLDPARPLTGEELDRIAAYQERRLAREPVSRIVGSREFWGKPFAINNAVLDPRPDTETVIDAAIRLLREEGRAHEPLRILDLGTGTGCILLTLLSELPEAWGLGIDRDPEALAVARANAEALGLGARASFACCNWLDAINGRFDCIISNPPYIRTSDIATLEPEVRCHDPHLALDGGPDGLDAYRRIIESMGNAARHESWVFFEAGLGQITGIVTLFDHAGWTPAPGRCRIYKDLAGVERVVAIKRQEA